MVVRRTDRDGDVAVTWTDGRLGTQVRRAVGVAQSEGCRPTARSRACGRRAELAAAVGLPIAESVADRQAEDSVSAGHATMGACRTLARTSPAACPLMASGCRSRPGRRRRGVPRCASRRAGRRRRASAGSEYRYRRAGGRPDRASRVVRPAQPVAVRGTPRPGDLRCCRICGPPRLPRSDHFLTRSSDDTTIVLAHAGGAKGKAVLDAARRVGAWQISCARLTRAEERLEFIRGEVRRAGGSITPDAAALLLDAVGSDLRELAQAAPTSSSPTRVAGVSADTVTAYYRGRAEVSGFAVSDRAVVGRCGRGTGDAALGAVHRHATRRRR